MAANKLVESHLGSDTYRSIFENMRSGVAYQKIVTDNKGNAVDFIFLEVNNAFANILGMKRDEPVGKKFSEVMPALKGSAFNWINFYGNIATTGREIKFEQFLQDAQRWYAVSAYSIKEGYFITIYDDITERKKAEESLRAAYDKLKATQAHLIQAEKMEAVGRLTTGITHEIKNPLAIIQQGLDYLNKKVSKKSNDVAFVLSSMGEATGRACETITSLLAFSRTTSEKMAPEDINEIIKSSLLLVKNDITRNSIAVVTSFAKNLPKINLDKISIQQVLINLLTNAVHAVQKGGKIRVCTSLKQDGSDKGHIIAVIEDSGSGIPEDVIDKIFDPFFTTKKVGEGTGLGLYIVKNIINAHRADIRIENRKDKSGVRVTLIFNL